MSTVGSGFQFKISEETYLQHSPQGCIDRVELRVSEGLLLECGKEQRVADLGENASWVCCRAL